MSDDHDLRLAEAASWKAWQTAWGNTESGAHAHGFAAGYTLARDEIDALRERCERAEAEAALLRGEIDTQVGEAVERWLARTMA